MDKTFLTSKETADYLGLTIKSLYSVVQKGQIRAYRPNGKKLLFKKEEIDAWVVRSVVNDMQNAYEYY